jgi:hypothetical protein
MSPRRALILALPALLLLAPGCDDAPPPPTPGVGATSAPAPAADPAPTAEAARPELKPRPILNQRTTDVRDAQKEIQSGAAVKAAPRRLTGDPITISGNAYVSIVGQSQILNIKHTLDLYQAETGSYPRDYKEFMDQIIKKNNISLPTLPYYQEYGYDEKTHQLIVLEYPH